NLKLNNPQACSALLHRNYLIVYSWPSDLYPVIVKGENIPFSQFPKFKIHTVDHSIRHWRNISANELIVNQQVIAQLKRANLYVRLKDNKWSSTMNLTVPQPNGDTIKCVYQGVNIPKDATLLLRY
ncbi:MAG: hypothetical protein AAGA27_08170, partial [Pseudomonadota bacterium]